MFGCRSGYKGLLELFVLLSLCILNNSFRGIIYFVIAELVINVIFCISSKSSGRNLQKCFVTSDKSNVKHIPVTPVSSSETTPTHARKAETNLVRSV